MPKFWACFVDVILERWTCGASITCTLSRDNWKHKNMEQISKLSYVFSFYVFMYSKLNCLNSPRSEEMRELLSTMLLLLCMLTNSLLGFLSLGILPFLPYDPKLFRQSCSVVLVHQISVHDVAMKRKHQN